MSTKLYVGNLPFNTVEQDLQELFGQHGAVSEVHVVHDKMTGRSRGFAFVTMADEDGAKGAISTLNGYKLDGRALTVNEARPREDRPPGGGGGYRGADRGGHGGGGYRSGGDRGDRRSFRRGE